MSDEQTGQEPRLVTAEDLAQLDRELDEAGAWLQNWEGRHRDLALAREGIARFIGRPVTDIEAALAEAEANLAAAEADLAAKRERHRDLQGYVRIQREKLAELMEQQDQAT
jgi:hypothetical protein